MAFGTPRNYYKKYLFEVQIDGIAWAGFMSCSGLSFETETIEINEGGLNRPAAKDPGRVKFEPITLKRGATDDLDTYAWAIAVNEGASGIGLPSQVVKRNVSIVQKDRSGVVLRRWNVVNAWPKKFTAGDWDNSSNEATIEEMVLEHDYFALAE